MIGLDAVSAETSLWLGIAAAIVGAILIVWMAPNELNEPARDAFVKSLSEDQRDRLAAHELLGGSWQSFQQILADEAGHLHAPPDGRAPA